MRTRSFVAVVLALWLATPLALANKPSLPSGTAIQFVGTGGKKTIKIVGTQACKFEVLVLSTNPSVAAVEFAEGVAKTSHVVTIRAVGVGSSDISIMTLNGTIPQCQGFLFTYPVTVAFDQKSFLKDGKKLLAGSVKDAKDITNVGLDLYCGDLADIADAYANGEIGFLEAWFEASEALGAFVDDLAITLDDLYEDAFYDLWSNNAQYVAPGADIVSFYPGGCGEWDKYRDKLNGLEDKLFKVAYKKFKSFEKALVKAALGDDDELLLVAEFPEFLLEVDDPVVLPAADPEAALPAPQPKNLEKRWTSAGRLASAETGSLEIGGVADPGAGDVTVTINGAGGFTTQVAVTVGAEDCAWKARFDGLAPGAYTVSVTQGANGPVGFGMRVP